jgi:hypothetical protein
MCYLQNPLSTRWSGDATLLICSAAHLNPIMGFSMAEHFGVEQNSNCTPSRQRLGQEKLGVRVLGSDLFLHFHHCINTYRMM